MKLTYFGHACFSVEFGGIHLVFDPFIRPNRRAAAIDFASIPADVIFISHGHEDHVADVVDLARQTGALVVSNWEVYEWLAKQGLENLHPMNHGGSKTLDFGRVKMVNAIHSSTLPGGVPGGNPGGFVISTGEGDFYYSGDTALTWDMKLIAEEFRPKFAVLPIGDNFTMGAKDAAKAAGFVGSPVVVGVHYDTFPYIEISKEAAQAEFAGTGVRLLLPGIGETIDL
jgi:L-ascorbate metabolism protein UlaG (beta-lactamase superfamily)